MNIRNLLGYIGLAFLFDRFADWVVTRAKRTPYFHLKDYMERYWLFRRGAFGLADADGHGAPEGGEGEQGARPALAARVHVILRSDADDHLHDHPWPHLSIILSGGYWEDVPFVHRGAAWVGETRRVWRGPGAIVFRRATSLHKLHIPDIETVRMSFDHEAGMTIEDGDPIPGTCTSLFIMGPQVRRWGFATPWGWSYWRAYLFGEAEKPQLSHVSAWRVAWIAFRAIFQRYPDANTLSTDHKPEESNPMADKSTRAAWVQGDPVLTPAGQGNTQLVLLFYKAQHAVMSEGDRWRAVLNEVTDADWAAAREAWDAEFGYGKPWDGGAPFHKEVVLLHTLKIAYRFLGTGPAACTNPPLAGEPA